MDLNTLLLKCRSQRLSLSPSCADMWVIFRSPRRAATPTFFPFTAHSPTPTTAAPTMLGHARGDHTGARAQS
jgi:hypothetical protein